MVDKLLLKSVVKGAITFIPGISFILERKKRGTHHSGSFAEFCYTLWLGLLHYLELNGIKKSFNNVGEIGCGGSVGVGICALLSGANNYYCLEIEDHFDKENNLKLLDDIVALFRSNSPIFNRYKQLNIPIKDYSFPTHLIIPRYFDEGFISELRDDIKNSCINSKHLKIIYNWQQSAELKLDFVFSRAVMEHVNDPLSVYADISRFVKNGTHSLHDIEFHSHGIKLNPAGHFKINNFLWYIISGKRQYFLNRTPLAEHINYLEKNNFKTIDIDKSFIINSQNSKSYLQGAIVLSQYIEG